MKKILKLNKGKQDDQYEDKIALRGAQDLFISLIHICIDLSESISHQDFNKQYYEILTLLFKRPELDLGQIGFSTEQCSDLFNDQNPQECF
jgi:hypothetical protein